MQALYEHGPDAKQYISSVSMTRAFCVVQYPIAVELSFLAREAFSAAVCVLLQ